MVNLDTVNLLGVIDESDKSINSNITSVVIRKDFYPQINSQSFYEICYQNSFDKDCDIMLWLKLQGDDFIIILFQ